MSSIRGGVLPTFLLSLLLTVFAVLAAGVPGPVRADEDPTDEEMERQEAVERHAAKAWKAFRSGNYDEARARIQRIRKYAPLSADASILDVRVDARIGDYEAALAAVEAGTEAHPENGVLRSLHYRLLLDLGRPEEVLARADAALVARPDDTAAHAARGLALEAVGRRGDAQAAYDRVIQGFNRGAAPAQDLLWVARAALRTTRISPDPGDDLMQDALRLLARWIDDHPNDQDAVLMYADVLQANRGVKSQSKAMKRYKLVLEDNPELAAARVGLARALLVFYQQDRAIRQIERALVSNPNFVPALSLLASIHIGNGDYEQADELLERAKKVSPGDARARAVRAAKAHITGEKDRYGALEKEALSKNPFDSDFFTTISRLVGERQRRYDIAAGLARRAIETDPDDGYAYTVLGEALMNLGRTEEAKKTFKEGVVRSKRYGDVHRDNWLEALHWLEGFETLTSRRFVLRVHPSEVAVMRHYLPDLMEEAWDVLSAKYGYTPKGPVKVDTFHRADDFSVRSVGTPGLPALGVCFGEVITLLGPTSRPLGSFSWSRTAWHEFAHTITLGESKGQVPRWLTEGLSVYEEKMRHAHWGREMERELYNRYHNDRLLRMAKINQAFRGPDIMFAYFQGGLIAEHLAKEYGFEVIPKMLVEFAKDRTTAQVFQDVLGIELDDYDRQLKAFVEGLVGSYHMVPVWDEKSLESFRKRVEEKPDDAEAWVRLGWAQLQRGRSIDAGAALAAARRLAPENPEVVLLEGTLAEKSGRRDLALRAYERFLGMGEDDLRVRMFLAGRELHGGSSRKAIEHLEAAKACFPTLVGKDSSYLALARLYEGAGRVEDAIGEYEAYSRVAGEDYGVRRKLKDYYKTKGNMAKVAQMADEMIEISPYGSNPGKPPDLDLHRDAAEAFEALGRGADALRELEVQVELVGLLDEPARVQAGAVEDHLRLGRRYLRDGRPLDALSQAAAALRLSPQDPKARILKGEAEEAAGYR